MCSYGLSAAVTAETGTIHPVDIRALITLLARLQRSVLVDNVDLGYPKGMLEIPAGATFELKVEVLSFSPRPT